MITYDIRFLNIFLISSSLYAYIINKNIGAVNVIRSDPDLILCSHSIPVNLHPDPIPCL